MIDDQTTVIRLVLAVLLGGLIGFERQQRKKSAGLRTHILVCLGSCLVAILSVNLYESVAGMTNADPARLAAQVVSGIGFLGAGAIMKEGPTIRGLTTAASLWVVASVGLAVGVGAYVGAVTTALLVVAILEMLPRIEKLYGREESSKAAYEMIIHSREKPGQLGQIGSCLGRFGISINQIHIEDTESGEILIPLTIRLPESVNITEVTAELAKLEGVLGVSKLRKS